MCDCLVSRGLDWAAASYFYSGDTWTCVASRKSYVISDSVVCWRLHTAAVAAAVGRV